eukprot:2841464-Pyramimonas_sp.AAC.1
MSLQYVAPTDAFDRTVGDDGLSGTDIYLLHGQGQGQGQGLGLGLGPPCVMWVVVNVNVSGWV